MAQPHGPTTSAHEQEDPSLQGMDALYVREANRLEAINGPFGQVMLEAARLQPGERVLDVGCGRGTTLQAAERVAPAGTAVGVDISAPLLGLAHRQAAAAGVGNVEFIHADARSYPFQDHDFDAVIGRFGTMFFQDPEAAFANLGRALRPGGRLAIVCPHDPSKTEWVAVAFAAAAPHEGVPDAGSPGAPGPFAFADGDRLRQVLQAGGFQDVTLQAVTRPVRMGEGAEDVTAFITSLPEARQLFAGKPQNEGGRGDRRPPASSGALRQRQGRAHEGNGLAGDGPPLTEAPTSCTGWDRPSSMAAIHDHRRGHGGSSHAGQRWRSR